MALIFDENTTLADVKTAYLVNSTYEAADSLTMAQDFVSACRALLLMLNKRVGKGGRSGFETETDPESIREAMREAQAFAKRKTIQSATGRTSYADFTRFRGGGG